MVSPFRRLRWAAMAWLVVFVVVYWRTYGPLNFLHLCDVAVILTCWGLWRASSLLLSSQALSSMVVDVLWNLDVLWRLVLGRHLIGGTEYMWDERFPLAVRLMSVFHLVWPVLLWWALRRIGYDRRALALQAGIAAALLIVSRMVLPEANINYAHRDLFLHRSWGPPPLHVGLTLLGLVTMVYWPTHRLLVRMMPAAQDEGPRRRLS